MQGKRGPEDHRAATWMQNMARPTGFMFSMAKGKKSEDLDADDFFEDTAAASFIDDSDIFEDDDDRADDDSDESTANDEKVEKITEEVSKDSVAKTIAKFGERRSKACSIL